MDSDDYEPSPEEIEWLRESADVPPREPTPDELRHMLARGDIGDWELVETTAPDDPPNRLHLDELHPLIREAAREPWGRDDYPQALKSAWNALRDEIRSRLGEFHLDGADLVNATGETAPKLALTDYGTETEQNMHRGIVNFLRGIVFYIRHPEMHEATSPVEGDKVGAFERLTVMSLCARHVVGASPPTALEDALVELRQPRFPRKKMAFDDLLRRLPTRRHSEFATMILAGALDAHSKGDQTFETLAAAYRHVVDESPDASIVSTSALELGRLIADDASLEAAMHLLPVKSAGDLVPRHGQKVMDLLHERARGGMAKETSHLDADMVRLFPTLRDAAREQILASLYRGLSNADPERSFYGHRQLCHLSHSFTDGELQEAGAKIAAAITRQEARFGSRRPLFLVALRRVGSSALREQVESNLRATSEVREMPDLASGSE